MDSFTPFDDRWVCSEPGPELFDVLVQLVPKLDDQRGGLALVSFGNNLLTEAANLIFHSTQRRTAFQTIQWLD